MLLEVAHFVLKPSYNFSVLSYLILHVMHVPLNICLNVLGPVGVLERVVSLLETLAATRDVGNHDCPAVAAQTVFEEASQLGVSVGYVVLLSFGLCM